MANLDHTLILGAVAYDAKVVPIWDGFRAWFAARGLAFDYVLFTNYERQVEAHLRGELDVAWNSPLAWLQAVRLGRARGRDVQTIAMRDTDRDLTSVVLARADGPIAAAADLRGKRLGVGAADSPQATLIPLVSLAEAGVEGFEVVRHDVLLGKHGDHIGGERDAVKAMLAGTVDAACVIDGNRLAFAREGLFAPNALRVVHHTAAYDHCNMTVLDHCKPALARFRELLLGMSYDDPEVRPLLDLEGLKQWQPGRVSGYALLERAIDRFDTIGPWLAAASRARAQG
jgi:phosphonate transport system substrate-binding protein